MNQGVNTTSHISIHAAQLAEGIALCSTIAFAADTADAPEWVHLLPAGTITTQDGRGPYTVANLAQLATDSLPAGERVVLDENHSTDLAAPEGRPAPAMGWIMALQARPDGLWGQVEWTDAGRRLVRSKKYRAISPVLKIDKQNRVVGFLRASLVNRPNIVGLETLHQENDVNPLLAKLIAALGLKDGTSEETLVTAVTALHQAQASTTTTLQSIATAAGLAATSTPTAELIVGAIGKLKTAGAGDNPTIVALQAELATVTTQLNAVTTSTARDKATSYVDGAIAEGRVGLKPLRDHYIERHMTNSVAVEKEIGAMPKLVGTTIVPAGVPNADAATSLNAEESEVARQLGIPVADFAKTRAAVAAVV